MSRLDEIEARVNDATSKPWVVVPREGKMSTVCSARGYCVFVQPQFSAKKKWNGDATLIAEGRTDIPDMARALRILIAEVKRLGVLDARGMRDAAAAVIAEMTGEGS